MEPGSVEMEIVEAQALWQFSNADKAQQCITFQEVIRM